MFQSQPQINVFDINVNFDENKLKKIQRKIFVVKKQQGNKFRYNNQIANEKIQKGLKLHQKTSSKENQQQNKKESKVELVNPYKQFDIPAKNNYSHNACQTLEIWENLDRKLLDQEKGVQSDALLSRTPVIDFQPLQTGFDKETQILSEDNLVDFDKEIEPLQQYLVNRILQEARMEVLEEIELRNFIDQRRQIQNVEIVLNNQIQKLQQQIKQEEKETKRRKLQVNIQQQQLQEIHKKMICQKTSQNLFKFINQNTQKKTEIKQRYFQFEKIKIEAQIMPQILQEVETYFCSDKIIANVIKNIANHTIQEVNKEFKLKSINKK